MIVTSPWMLLGLLALPALAAIYLLRTRSRRLVVSNCDFWVDPNRPRQGGRILHRMQTPLSLFLELLAIAMLVLAAAGPALLRRDVARPLIVVLDDSYSMLARPAGEGAGSVRDRAETALAEELKANTYVARFIAAGVQPRLLGDSLQTAANLDQVLSAWECQSPSADLPAALSLAAKMGGPTARILVLTDHAPPMTLDTGKLQWWAFGEKQANVAFTAATRTPCGETDRVLLEITRLSDDAGETTLTLEGGGLAAPRVSPIRLEAGASRQIILNLPAGAAPLRAKLGDDALAIDNEVVLLSAAAKPLRVSVNLADAGLRRAVLRALDATGQAVQVSDRPELIVSDAAGTTAGAAWRWEIATGTETAAYLGPFVIDRNHPLARGLSLQNVIWSAPAKARPAGSWIVSAGNVPLMTERVDIAGRHRLRMSLAADESTLLETPDWPILVANIVQWRRGALPGPATANARLGQTVPVALAADAKQVKVVSPGGGARTSEVHNRQVAVSADRVGLFTVETAEGAYRFSCNTVSRDESNLADCRSARWGDWNRSPDYQDRRIPLSWICLLAAAATMAGHMALVSGDRGGTGK